MRPKFILWIAFGGAAVAWYALDPAAQPIGDVLANEPGIARPWIANALPQQPTTHKASANLALADDPRGD